MIRRFNTHVSNNLWLWSGICALAAVVFTVLRNLYGIGHHYGDLAAFAGMGVGILLALIAQRSLPPREELEEA